MVLFWWFGCCLCVLFTLLAYCWWFGCVIVYSAVYGCVSRFVVGMVVCCLWVWLLVVVWSLFGVGCFVGC